MKKRYSPEGEIKPLELIYMYWLLELIFIFNNISKNQIFPKFIFIIYYNIKIHRDTKCFKHMVFFECSKFKMYLSPFGKCAVFCFSSWALVWLLWGFAPNTSRVDWPPTESTRNDLHYAGYFGSRWDKVTLFHVFFHIISTMTVVLKADSLSRKCLN